MTISGLRRDLETLSTAFPNALQTQRYQTTCGRFWKAIDQLDQSKIQFYTELQKQLSSAGGLVSFKTNASDSILQFCQYMKDVMRNTLAEEVPSYIKYLAIYGPSTEKQNLIKLKKTFRPLRIWQKVQDLNNIINYPLPLQAFVKMAYAQELNADDKRILKAWIAAKEKSRFKKIPTPSGSCPNTFTTSRFQYHLIFDLVNVFHDLELIPGQKPELGLVLASLKQMGDRWMDQIDLKHLNWRQSFKPTDTILIAGKKYVLAEILANPEKQLMHPIIFSVQGRKDIEIVLPVNEWDTFVQDLLEREYACGLICRRVLAIKSYGNAYIRERLSNQLHLIEWKKGLNLPDALDIKKAEPIVALIKRFNELEFTPHPLKPEIFGFTEQGEMRAVQCLIGGSRNFEEMELFLASTVQADPVLFSYLMKATGLNHAEEAKAYQNLVKEAAADPKDPSEIISCGKAELPSDILSARSNLFYSILQLKRSCLEALESKHKNPEKALRQSIVEMHQENCPGSILTANFKEAVLRRTQELLNVKISRTKQERKKIAAPIKSAHQKKKIKYKLVMKNPFKLTD